MPITNSTPHGNSRPNTSPSETSNDTPSTAKCPLNNFYNFLATIKYLSTKFGKMTLKITLANSEKLADWISTVDDALHLGRYPGHGAQRAGVQQSVHDRGVQVGDGDAVASRLSAVASGGADDTAHLQSASIQHQRRHASPVLPTALGVHLGRAAHLTAADEQDFVAQPARLNVLDERAHRMVERRADVAHALDHCGVVRVGVHVPHEVGGDGDEARAALSQAPGEQQQLAEAVHVLGIARMVVPLFADARDIHKLRCVVSLDHIGVFAGNVECLRHATRERLIGLRLEPVEALGDVALADNPTPLVELG